MKCSGVAIVALIVALLPFGGGVFGQEAKPPTSLASPDARVLDPVVVTATKVETLQSRLGASVTVVPEEEIRTYNYSRIEEALRSVPGVEVQRSGGLGKITNITIRGANASQVQVLIDGMRVKSPTLGQFDFSDVSLDAIDRIEVVRGPQSTLHGADAIGGVINIITKPGVGPPSGTLFFEGGNFHTFREQVSTSGALGPVDFSFSGSRLDTHGQERTFKNDDADQTAAAARLGVKLPWNASLVATGRHSTARTDTPVNLFFNTRDPDSQQQTDFSLLTGRYQQLVFPWWEVAARAGWMSNDQGFQNGPLPVGDLAFKSQTDTRRREFELLNTFHIAKFDSVTLGFEHRRERGHGFSASDATAFGPETVTSFTAKTTTISGFLQNELRLFDRLFVGAGFRHEENDAFGSATTPHASLAFLVTETGTKLRGAWGKGFRAPTLNDLFFPDLSSGFCPPFSNVALRPERSRSWEVGFDQKAWENRIRGGVTYFDTRFRDLITTTNVDPTALGVAAGFPNGSCQQETNAGRAVSRGTEASLAIEPLDWLGLAANYTFTDTEDQTRHRPLPRVARHRWNFGVTVTPLPRLTLFVQAYAVSRQYEPITDRYNAPYHRIDAGGTWRLVERWGILRAIDLTLRIQNLTDEDYKEVAGFRSLGFAGLAGLRATFQ
jgi:vitamin B12 transporter